MKNLRFFVLDNNIRVARCESVYANPNMSEDMDMFHYKVVLTANTSGNGHRSQLTTFFSVGSGWKRFPDVLDVLNCLASESASFENAISFEEWAGEMGFDSDSRKAERTFKAIEKQAANLKRFLGEEAYKELLWNTEL